MIDLPLSITDLWQWARWALRTLLIVAIFQGFDRRVGIRTNIVLILLKFLDMVGLGRTVKGMRRLSEIGQRFAPAPIKIHHTEDIKIPSTFGKHEIPVTLFYPKGWDGATVLPLTIFFHGGGFALGSVRDYEPVTRSLANGSNCVVGSVEYRLAPDHPFPAAPEDCIDATRYLITHCARFHADENRVAVMGDSAGGNLAAGVAIQLASLRIPVLLQVLVYPMVDCFAPLNGNYPSWVSCNTSLLSNARMLWFTRMYLQDWKDAHDFRASPLLATDEELRLVAPMHLLAAEIDPLLDDGKVYLDRLEGLGVKTSYTVFKRATHGCFSMGMLDGCKESRRAASAILHKAFYPQQK